MKTVTAILLAVAALLCVAKGAPPEPKTHASEPEIVGSDPFRKQVRQALRLLETRDANAYQIVTAYIQRIEQGERSGMWANNDPYFRIERQDGLLFRD